MKKVVLAYSGGLDTSVMIKWLKEKYKVEIIAFSANLGQTVNIKNFKKKALAIGANKIYFEDLREEFIKEYVFPALKANAIYETKYFLATALSRPLIAKKLVEIAEKEKAETVVHGCTGKGNDQVRIELGVKMLNPSLEILAPAREWEFKNRIEEIEYAKKHHLPVEVTKKKSYSIDENLWGVSIEGGALEDIENEPKEDVFQITEPLEKTPNKPTYLELGFEKGIPVSINHQKISPLKLIQKLNKIGKINGIGRIDLIESRLVGIKSREIYEAPAAAILFLAHKELESLVLDRDFLHFKEQFALKYAELVYYGLWFSPLTKALNAFVNETQKNVTGAIKVKLYKGNIIICSRKSPYSLYRKALATYETGDIFDHRAAKGFIKIFGLPYTTKIKEE